jgi:hypothetical protein
MALDAAGDRAEVVKEIALEVAVRVRDKAVVEEEDSEINKK